LFTTMDAPMVRKADNGLEVPESMVYFVFMTMFIDVIAACISTPVMPYYAQEFGVSTAWIGYIYAAWSVTSALFAPILSGMADKWGRKRVMVTCLTGAGVANVIQGCALYFGHNGFWVFLFGRAFSGCFASIGATCNVYITDVCTNEATRNKYLGQMSMVPLVAIMVGPGLGGGLAAAFGNNVPVLIDGCITLFSACVVHSFLEESPAFLRSRLNADVEKGDNSPKKEKPALPTAIWVVGLASLTASLAGQMNLSMYSLFFQKIYDFSALYIGFVFMGNAVVMLLTNMVILPKLRKCFKSAQMYFGGALISGTGVISLGCYPPSPRLR
jgi:MFS family permease